MSNSNIRPTAPCLINEGTIINKKDMVRALETLECVDYSDVIDGKLRSKGEGIIIKVFASKDSSTLIINGSIFLNVMSFDYLAYYINKSNETIVELNSGPRMLRLIPREEDPKLMAKINQNSYCYQDDFCESEDICAKHLLDENLYDDDDER
jgi:hypothetical protein